jgi:aspartate aminotransferase
MVSQRANLIENSITLKLTALANQMKKEGLDVVGFGAGEPDFDTPEHIKQAAIKAIQDGKNKYTAETGILELRTAICEKFLKDNQLTYKPENIVVSCGAKHSIFNAMCAIIDPGDEVIIPSPYWVSYPYQVIFAGGKPVYIQATEKQNFKITPEQLKKAITPKTKAFILNSPSNPTGMLYSKEELTQLAKILLEHNVYIISDEIYEDLNYGNIPHFSIAAVSDAVKKLTIVINGVSKSYAMTGWRIGYLAADLPIAQAVAKIQSHSTSNPTTVAQWASLQALTGPKDAVQAMKKEFDARRKFMVDALNAMPNINCAEPLGAFYAFPNISGCFGKKTKQGALINNSMDFCNLLLKEALVSCVPGIGFGQDEYMRLSYATSMANIKKGLDRLKIWVEGLS